MRSGTASPTTSPAYSLSSCWKYHGARATWPGSPASSASTRRTSATVNGKRSSSSTRSTPAPPAAPSAAAAARSLAAFARGVTRTTRRTCGAAARRRAMFPSTKPAASFAPTGTTASTSILRRRK